jgi:hypothetical protein
MDVRNDSAALDCDAAALELDAAGSDEVALELADASPAEQLDTSEPV